MCYYCYGTPRQSCLPVADSFVLKFKLQVKNWVQLRLFSPRWVLQQAQLIWTDQLCAKVLFKQREVLDFAGVCCFRKICSSFSSIFLQTWEIIIIIVHLYFRYKETKISATAVSHVTVEFSEILLSVSALCMHISKWCCWETCPCTWQKMNSLKSWNAVPLIIPCGMFPLN